MQFEIIETKALRNLETGEIILLPYRYVKLQDNGLSRVRDENGLYGIINQEEKEIVPPKYTWIDDFHNGLARVRDENELYGLINEKGEEVIKPEYEKISFQYIKPNEVVVINKDNETYQIIRGDGE